MACNWLMTSSGDDNKPSGSLGLLTDKTKKKNKPKAEQETAQPTAARFKKNQEKIPLRGFSLRRYPLRVLLTTHEVISCLAIAPDRLSLIQS